MIKEKFANICSRISSLMFAAMFLFLPFTSFPLISKLFGGASVAPLSVLPAFILVILLVLPNVIRRQYFSIQFKPLLLFFLFSILSTFLVFFRDTPSFRDTHFLNNALESVVTLLIGFSFYYLCSHFLTSEEKIKNVLKWMNIGAFVLIAFSFLQILYIRTPLDDYPAWLRKLTYLISSVGMVFPRRISGLAFEPSWLAHQLNILYLPVWLGFSLKGYSIYKTRILKRITIENILLLFGILMLFLSFSKIGWITFGFLIVYILIRVVRSIYYKTVQRLETKQNKKFTKAQSFILKMFTWLIVLLISIIMAVIAAKVMAWLDPKRSADLLNFKALKERGLYSWANLLRIAERLVYWTIGFRTFQIHPWFGVGLGAVGYYFASTIPAFGYKLPDLVHIFNYENFIPNAKNIWARLLSETGIIGTAFFISWIYLQWKASVELDNNKHSVPYQAFGLVGKLSVIAFIFEGFSMDTFGLPYYWVAFGLVVAAWRILKNTQLDEISVVDENPIAQIDKTVID